MIRLRKVVSDEFLDQEPLLPIKRLMEALFFIGPGCILISLYLPESSFPLVVMGILSLAVASLYWFAPHWLCRQYLRYRGFSQGEQVMAPDFKSALERGRSA